jgi:hypothetical protein
VVEGRVYTACMPTNLRNAVKDFRAKRISEETFRQRIEARRAYEARRKRGKNGDDIYIYRCPGAGAHRTVNCDLKPVDEGRIHLPLVVTQPEVKPACCTNAESVSVPAEKFARYVTDMPYQSEEWSAYYRHARNLIEGKNQVLKNPLASNIAIAGERRFRGYGKHFLTLLVKFVAANVEVITALIDESEKKALPPTPTKRGRPKKKGISEHAPDPHGPPIRIVGPERKVA